MINEEFVALLTERFKEIVKNITWLQEEAGDSESAADQLRESLQLFPNEVDFLLDLSRILKSLERLSESEEFAIRAVNADPSNFLCHYQLGNVYRRGEKFEDAVDCYRSALMLSPCDLDSLNNLGLTLYDLGEFEEAEKVIDIGLTMYGEDPDLLSNKAWILFRKQRYIESRNWFDKMLDVDHSNANAYYGIGKCLTALGDEAGAARAFETSDQIEAIAELFGNASTTDP